jgi:hypothetical protein
MTDFGRLNKNRLVADLRAFRRRYDAHRSVRLRGATFAEMAGFAADSIALDDTHRRNPHD